MKKTVFAFLLALIILASASASADESDPVTLKCFHKNGSPAAWMTLSIDKNVLKFGSGNYSITDINDGYISAYRNSEFGTYDYGKVGGTTLVLDRKIGELTLATIAMYCVDEECVSRKLDSKTTKLHCS